MQLKSFYRILLLLLLFLLLFMQEGGLCAEEKPRKSAAESLQSVLEKLPFSTHGFLEVRGGIRTQNDPQISKDLTLGEPRLQLDLGKVFDQAELRAKADFLYDAVLERGDVDLREANVLVTPFDFVDVKAGRQILTWGTGDLLFINDLFPKDWKSFFIGRDDEYLKAPSDAVKASFFFSKLFNVDVVYVPQFDPDRYIEGERLSYWSDSLKRLAGEKNKVNADEPNDFFSDSETALRVYKNIKGYELAAYGYYGFWKSPAGQDPATGKAIFPALGVYGGSVRGSFLKGIASLEAGYYDSRDDPGGGNPNVRNSELRFLARYEREIKRNFTAGVQYYLEYIMNYRDYRRTLSEGIPPDDKDRHVITLRLTRLLMNQNLRLSLFAYYSPTDQDVHVRPKVHYKISDHWSVEAGANVFAGKENYTFFGQFKNNTNVYTGLRFSF